MRPFNIIFTFLVLGFFALSCSKNIDYNPQGGNLPTNYIVLKENGFSPQFLTVVSGSSITFVNQTTVPHTLRTSDSITIPPVSIAANSSFFFKKDTSGTFSYYCEIHPAETGIIIITP